MKSNRILCAAAVLALGLSTQVAAQQLKILPPSGNHMVMQSKDAPVCVASLATSSANGRDANLSYHIHAELGEAIFFGLKPLSGQKARQDRISVQLDGNELLFVQVKIDKTGSLQIPIERGSKFTRFLGSMSAGKKLIVLFEKEEDAIVIEVAELRAMKSDLISCLERL